MGPVDPNSVAAFIPILIMVVVAAGFAAFTLTASHFLGIRVDSVAKSLPYECGVTPVGNARERFNTRFYLVAMLFIVFDIETVFLYPWAVVFRELGLFAFVEMMLFILILMVGFAYAWRKGALTWR